MYFNNPEEKQKIFNYLMYVYTSSHWNTNYFVADFFLNALD